jgi:hypothetical protein
MRRILALPFLLLLAVVHTPSSAQALVFSVFQDYLALPTGEPGMLLVTGVSLLTLAQLGRPRAR